MKKKKKLRGKEKLDGKRKQQELNIISITNKKVNKEMCFFNSFGLQTLAFVNLLLFLLYDFVIKSVEKLLLKKV